MAAVATFVAVLLGTAMMASFATMVETALGADNADRELLFILGVVVGGWSALIVLFSVASTVGIVAEQRAREAALLRAIGATPGQARALIVYEAVVVALLAALTGAVVASIGGYLLFRALQHGHLITSASAYRGSPVSLGAAAAVVVLVGSVAAVISSRRATRGPAGISLRAAEAPVRRLRWWRILVGTLLVVSGLASAIVTITVTGRATEAYPAMSTSGSAAIVVGVGLAALAPWLLRMLATPLRPLLSRGGGSDRAGGELAGAGHLAAENTIRRSYLLAGMLAPVIVFVATAVGTLLMIGIDSRTLKAAGDPADVAATITTINAVVVGMISLFAAIMVVNASVAVVAHRRPELERLRRLGATTGQLRTSIVLEAAVVAVVGIVLGLVASTATVVPYSIVRHEGIVPNGQLWLPPLVAVAAAVLTVGAAWGAQHRALR
jgi:putative ABC transport system permease protein